MSEFLPVKSIYTGTEVTALGEAAPDDVMLSPDGGIKFPDGSIQLSAQSGGGTLVDEAPPTASPKATWFESDTGRMFLLYDNPDGQKVWVEANAAGTRGLTGATGAAGPQGEQGIQGDIGPQGIQGETGLTGAKGDTGEIGPAGPKGDKGDVGAQGPAGPQGGVGPAGMAGPKGDTGPAGPQGEIGPAGPKGDTGDAGPQGEVGPVGPKGDTGDQGTPGVGIVFRGRVPTVADLPTTAEQGDMWVVDETGDAWVWSDSSGAFENVGPIVGPAGIQGEQGPAGPQGAVGPQGPAGADGAIGPAGPQGPAGADGAAGPQGIQGEIGPQGPAGANGADSTVPGPQGPAGPSDWYAIPNIPPIAYNDGGTYSINITGSAGSAATAGTATYAEYVNNDAAGMRFHWSDSGTPISYLWGSDEPSNARLITKSTLFAGYYDAGTCDGRYTYKTGDTMTGDLAVAKANAAIGLNDIGGSFAAYGIGCDYVNWGNFFADRAQNYLIIGTDTQRDFVFKTYSGDRGRFTSNGQFLVGVSSQAGSNGRAGTIAALGYNTKPGVSAGLEPYTFNLSWVGAMNLYVDDINLGSISLVSDYRIKTNVTESTGTGISQLMQMRPVTYTFKTVGKHFKESPRVIKGFIAHELEHIPGAVEGEKDELTESGEIQPQRLNPLPLIATLVEAAKEQQALIEKMTADMAAMRAEIDALKAA